MRRLLNVLFVTSTLTATAAAAQPAVEAPPAPPITVSGSVAVATDYRFRGVSQTDKEIAVQGGITVTHESGVYLGTWGSNLAGWGTFGGANLELDLIAGYKHTFASGAALDVGVTVYTYPGGADTTTVVESYAKLGGTFGGAALLAGIAYAPKQKSLGRVFETGAAAAAGLPNDPGDKEDNVYVWGDAGYAIAGTPLTAKGHIGHSWGNKGLGPNGTSLTPTGSYTDWLLGVDATFGKLTVGVAYIDTDISRSEAAYLQPNFSKGGDGTGRIAGPTVLGSLSVAF